MRAWIVSFVAATFIFTSLGCESSGLSLRENPRRDYVSYAYAMYAPSVASSQTPRQPLVLPAKIAVAQLGEVGPPQAMLDTLRKDSTLVKSAQSIPGATSDPAPMPVAPMASSVDGRNIDASTRLRRQASDDAEIMRRYARDVGAQYLFVFGGTLDRETTDTGYKLANATIVGAFVVPTERIQASARAAGSLVDVQSGHVVLSVAADAQQNRMTPSVSRRGNELELMTALRDEVINKLAIQLQERLKDEGKSAG